ncbi:MAG: sulfotransferase [Candidatus Omnitrophica bacterium]|nr:sulfotransferase [Candidatus Omnitrophota bacterium]
MNKYKFFDFSENILTFNPVFLVGACRSGKSSLGCLLGSLEHCFHIEENWTLLTMPTMCEKGLIDKDVFLNMYRACINELVYDAVLMRSASFRSTDHSYIGKMKSSTEIDHFVSGFQSRQDVDDYMRDNDVTIVFNLAEINPYIDLLKEVYPKAKIVHMNRNPFVVADEVDAKEWFSDQSINAPGNKQIFLHVDTGNGKRYIPFWVAEEDVDRFVDMTSEERAFYYILRQYQLTAEAISRSNSDNIVFIDYEDLINDPAGCLRAIIPDIKNGGMTSGLIEELKGRSELRSARHEIAEIDLRKVNLINEFIPGFKKRYF